MVYLNALLHDFMIEVLNNKMMFERSTNINILWHSMTWKMYG